VSQRPDSAARDVASANASYLISSGLDAAVPIVEAIGDAMVKRFGAFILLDIGELEHDRLLTEDAPYLPPFEITVSTVGETAAHAAVSAFTKAVEGIEVKCRSPRLRKMHSSNDPCARLAALVTDYPCITVRFAPIYRLPESKGIYPELRQRLIANMFDAGLQAVAAFVEATGSFALSTHRALGRQAFVDAVSRADRSINEIAANFDFLLAVTPINADAAWSEFKASRFRRAPRFRYRPLTIQVDVEKQKLFSIAFDGFEDPVLFDLYREKQQELDLQLAMLSARETPRFVDIGRALYGAVEPTLLNEAKEILAKTEKMGAGDGLGGSADCYFVKREADSMIQSYQTQYAGFDATVKLRDDPPAGLMVSGACLLISRSTKMARRRVEPLQPRSRGPPADLFQRFRPKAAFISIGSRRL
jgi:Microtubule-associated tyrosine carboxypeptidase